MNVEKLYKGTALVQAARLGHVKRFQALITAGADVNKCYMSGTLKKYMVYPKFMLVFC